MLHSKNLLTALALTVALSAGAGAATADVVSAKLVDFTPYAWLPISVDGYDEGYKPAGVSHLLVEGQPEAAFCLELEKPVLLDGSAFEAAQSIPPTSTPWCEIGYLLATYPPFDSASASVLQLAVWKLSHGHRLPPEVVTSPDADGDAEFAALALVAESLGRCVMTCAPAGLQVTLGNAGPNMVGTVSLVQGGLPVVGQKIAVHATGGALLQPAGGFGLTDGAGRLAVVVAPFGAGAVTVTAGTLGSDLRVLDPLDDTLQALVVFGDPCSFTASATWQGCVPAPDDNCNGVDDDCDGVIDDDAPVTVTSCGTGICANTGNRHCVGGVWIDTCHPGVPAGYDAECNGHDDDCDGQTDEGYVPVPSTCGEGVCGAHGQLLCVNGAIIDTCVPGTPGGVDSTCDGLDNDCDGQTDEGYIPVPTTCGVGACGSSGWLRCTNGQIVDTCEPGLPTVDTDCDGIDDDCDGQIDEDGDCDDDCGDGVVQPGEGCDDGNQVAGDGCSPSCQVEGCIDDLGVPGHFNVFAFDTVCELPDVGGAVAAGVLVTTSGFSFGHQHPGGDALVAGGAAELSYGTIHGDAWVVGTAAFESVDFQGGELHQGPRVDFAAAEDGAVALCARLAALPATGTVTVEGAPWATLLVLEGTLPGLNVFELPATLLADANSFTLRVPATATVLINVSGAEVSVQNFGFFFEGAEATRTLWNACAATLVEAQAIGMKGTLLAPNAEVLFDNGSWDGTIIAQTVCGSGEPHWVPFTGELPCE
jgi:choice-of-anchor A domain-containing protein